MRPIESGSPASPVWLIGEAPGGDEVSSGRPFSGASGQELDRMLAEAGISRSECFATNVCHERPPSYVKNGKVIHNDINQFFASKRDAVVEHLPTRDGRFPRPPITEGLAHLHRSIDHHRPRLIIALGNTPLWALCGKMGITKWRGSVLPATEGTAKVVPTFHPADVLRAWTHRPIVVQDFRRAAREQDTPYVTPQDAYGWEFVTAPTLTDTFDWFHTHVHADRPLVCDTEGWGRVDCIGFASDDRHAICIPFTRQVAEPSACHYWDYGDELTVTNACRTVLSTAPIIFHNALWDCQVIARRWGMMPRLYGDTMVAQHVAFPGLLGGKIDPVTGEVEKKGSSLSLSFLASMYCAHYAYWKDDGRHFDPSIHSEEQYWRYNCEDCVRTFECADELFLRDRAVLDRLHLRDQYADTMRLYAPVFKMMFRGIRYDRAAHAAAQRFFGHIERKAGRVTRWQPGAITDAQEWLNTATACDDFNPDSSPQMRALFYGDLRLPERKNRKTGAPTLDDAALEAIARANPLLRPLVSQIQNYRTLDTLRGSLDISLSPDQRWRHALNVAFVETFRFSSNETAFGEGANLQNVKRPDFD